MFWTRLGWRRLKLRRPLVERGSGEPATGTALHPISMDLVDPQMRRQLQKFRQALGPMGFRSIADLSARREAHRQLGRLASARAKEQVQVQRDDLIIHRRAGVPALQVRVYRSSRPGPGGAASRPGLLYLHGGGLIMGSVEADDSYAAALTDATGAVTVSVEYRLAPEHPFPAALDDCTDALVWMTSQEGPMDIDATRVGVFGSSAGGGLAVGLALRTRDHGGPRLRHLVLAAPMLDDRPGRRPNHVPLGIWDVEHNEEAWAYALGGRAGDADVSSHAAPARETDLRNVPPVYLDVGALDLFFSESVSFVQRLADALVPVELHVYPGTYHGFEQLAPSAQSTTLAWTHRARSIRRVLGQ